MFRPKSFIELCYAMQTRARVDINGVVGLVNGISCEDGTGRSFIVHMLTVEQGLVDTYFRESALAT